MKRIESVLIWTVVGAVIGIGLAAIGGIGELTMIEPGTDSMPHFVSSCGILGATFAIIGGMIGLIINLLTPKR